VAVAVLLDTSAYAWMKRGHAETLARIRKAERVLFSTIVAGELLAGFRQGSRYEANVVEMEGFLAEEHVSLLDVTWKTAERFGLVMAGLRGRGTPIPTNDVWLAAQAMETGARLLTGDTHFRRVEGLDLALLSP